MSDFLDNLISRSLNRLEVVQPRLASIFELQTFAPPALPLSEFADEQSEVPEVSKEVDRTAPSPTQVRTARLPLPTLRPAFEAETVETVSLREPAKGAQAQPEQARQGQAQLEEPPRHRAKGLPPSPPAGIVDTPSAAQPVVRQGEPRPLPPRPSPTVRLRMLESPPVSNTETKRGSISQAAQPAALPETNTERPDVRNERPRRPPLVSPPVTQRLLERIFAPVKSAPPGPLEKEARQKEAQPSPRVESPEVRRLIDDARAQVIPAARGAAPRQPPLTSPHASLVSPHVSLVSPRALPVNPHVELSPTTPAPRATSPGRVTAQPVVRRQTPLAVVRHDEPGGGAADEPPSIQVTIGRIEVRAATESQPRPSRQHPASPLMSLSDYLRRRSSEGGSR